MYAHTVIETCPCSLTLAMFNSQRFVLLFTKLTSRACHVTRLHFVINLRIWWTLTLYFENLTIAPFLYPSPMLRKILHPHARPALAVGYSIHAPPPS